jgi:16S rRNA processing protein RimM
LRGEVLVEVLSDVPHRFAPGRSLLLVRNGKPPEELVVAGSRAHGGGRSRVGAAAEGPAVPRRGREEAALVQFRGIDDRERADTLRGGWLEIERSLAAPAPVGTYYHYELLGCRCVQGGADLGEVVEVLEDGGGLLLLVSDGSREVPVPFVKRFLCAVDVAARRIEVDLPPGLLEVCASRS